MTDPRSESLSRLLDGELSPAEEAHLRAEIAYDPVLAARWRTLQGLGPALAMLPLDAPPVGLALPHRRMGGRGAWFTAAAAAAAVLAVGWPRAQADRVLVDGSELINGTAAVVVPGGRIEVDGLARVDVEPGEGFARETERNHEEYDTMRTHLLAAAAGAAVTVTVYEGSARFQPSEGGDVRVEAGQTETLGQPNRRSAVRTPKPDEASPTTAAEDAAERIGALEAELAELRFQAALARGQVAAHEGTPRDWPEGLAERWQPGAYEQAVRAAAETQPDVEVVDVDCSEYPCITLLRSLSEGDDWEEGLKAVHERLQDGPLAGEEVAVGAWNMLIDDDEGGEQRLQGLVMQPTEQADDDRTRTDFRVRSMLEAATERTGEAP